MEEVTTLADVVKLIPTIPWLWEWGLPQGLLTGLVADSGKGKSSVALAVAKPIIIPGERFPDGAECTQHGCILYADTESSQGVLGKRAQSWGYPLESILMPRGPLDDFQADNADHFRRLEDLIELEKPPLVVFDSLRGAHKGNENSSEVFETMSKLARLARDFSIAVLIVHHLRKSNMVEQQKGSKITLDRVRGSSAIVQLCRVIWAVDEPDPNSDLKRLSVIKSNLGPFPEPLGFRIAENGVVWGPAPEEPHTETSTDKATEFLRGALWSKERWAAELYTEADEIGLSHSALRRAKGQMNIPSIKRNGRWVWGKIPHKEHLES